MPEAVPGYRLQVVDEQDQPVAPGEIATGMTGPEYESLIPRIPLNRMGTAEEVAAIVFQLCGDDFGYVTGTEVFVTGGQHLF